MLLIETVYDLLQAKAAINGARRAMAAAGTLVPIMVQVTVETTGRMLVGTEIGAALTALEAMRPDVIGMNCATGPAEMTEHLRYLAQHARTFLSCLPNAGLPSVVDGHTHYDLTPELLADAHERFVSEFGLNIVGGCCGTTPEHLRAVVERLGRRAPPIVRTPEFEPGCSSIYSHVPFHQELAYLAVGERTNANGSRKFRDAMLEADWDTCVQMAREQVKEGAHVLDVCVDYVGRDGTVDMDEIAGRFATQACAAARVRLDRAAAWSKPACATTAARRSSTRPTSKRATAKASAWTACSRSRASTARRSSASRSTKKARRATPTGSCASRSASTTSRSSGTASNRPTSSSTRSRSRSPPATTTCAATRWRRSRRSAGSRRSCPGASTILGLSNVSFGLKPAARHVLNSVFLHECREAGLDAAIVHAARIMPMHQIDDRQREVALDLIYDRRRDELRPAHRVHGAVRRRRRGRDRDARTVRAGRSKSG